MSSWPTYLVNLQTPLMLIRPLVLTLIQEELKPTFLTLLVVLSLISSIISCFNVISTFVPICAIQYRYCKNQLCNDLPHWSCPELV